MAWPSALAFAGSAACLVPAGIVLGAAVGAVGGGLYYLLDELIVWLFRGVPKPALEPITEADADVLLGWIYGPKLCRRWAGEQFTWPLDREQLVAHFSSAGEGAGRQIFKTIDARTGNMFGYAEIHFIGPVRRGARLEMAIVDTGASERGRLSLLLLRTLANYAFRRFELASLFVASDTREPEVAACFDRVCQTYPELHSIRKETTVPPAIP
jgi:hypothetical protein